MCEVEEGSCYLGGVSHVIRDGLVCWRERCTPGTLRLAARRSSRLSKVWYEGTDEHVIRLELPSVKPSLAYHSIGTLEVWGFDAEAS